MTKLHKLPASAARQGVTGAPRTSRPDLHQDNSDAIGRWETEGGAPAKPGPKSRLPRIVRRRRRHVLPDDKARGEGRATGSRRAV